MPRTRPKRGSGPSRPFPARLLDLRLGEREIVPHYLSIPDDLALVERAETWLRQQAGKRRADVEATEMEACPPGCRRARWRALIHLIRGLCGYTVSCPIQPALLREAVFDLASAGPPHERETVLDAVAARFGLPAASIEQWLYADIPAQRRLAPLPGVVDPARIVRGYNLALAQGLLLRCEWVRICAATNLTPILRHARRQRLLCLVEQQQDGAEHGGWIHASGPLSLFHHTTRYGRALAGWLPLIVRAPGWRLEASCRLSGMGPRRFVASHNDPISAVEGQPLRPFDSKLEATFARDLMREAGDRLIVLREADPVQVGNRVVCPDFTLVDRDRPIRVGVEIVGYWTPEYLSRKFALLRQVSAPWVVCVDENLAAGREGELPSGPLFIFRRRINVRAFLDFLQSNRLLR